MAKIVIFGDTCVNVNEIAILSTDVEKNYKGEVEKYKLLITFKRNSVQHSYNFDPSGYNKFVDAYNRIKGALLGYR